VSVFHVLLGSAHREWARVVLSRFGLIGDIVATGSSVTKTASGDEEIVVQGDNSDDIFDWVVDVGKVPEDNVECIEDKKKKSAG